MKNLPVLAAIILCLLNLPSFAQTDTPNIKMNMGEFMENSIIAEWLCIYDRIAWATSDSIMVEDPEKHKLLGPEWFCYFDDSKKQWHAFYGALDEEGQNYTPVFHYAIDTLSYQVRRTSQVIDSSKINPLARGVSYGFKLLINEGLMQPLRWNWYVRYNEEENIEFYAFPAFQPDGKAPYGAELYLLFDSKGNKVLEKRILKEEIRYFMPDKNKEIVLQYKQGKQVPLGGIFYAMYYEKYFGTIMVEHPAGLSNYMNTDDNSWWMHIDKGDLEIMQKKAAQGVEEKTKKEALEASKKSKKKKKGKRSKKGKKE